jgi:hypothetical protein
LKIFDDFSRENHGHGGHEHGVRRRVFRGKLAFKKMSAAQGQICFFPRHAGTRREALKDLVLK